MKLLEQMVLQPDAITQFSGPYRFLSNFWLVPVRYAHFTYGSVEQAYQAAKTFDPVQRAHIIAAKGPWEAKQRGKTVTLRPNWDKLKVPIMEGLLRQKFAFGTNCGNLLGATKNRQLVEGNDWHDNFWGVCVCGCGGWHAVSDPLPAGTNHLGQLLMLIRDDNR